MRKKDGEMYILILNWDLSKTSREIFKTLREYIKNESWKRYENKNGLIQKTWYSNEETGQFGAVYLWETKQAMEEEVSTMYRVKAMTGVDPSIAKYDIEALQEGKHNVKKLTEIGLAWNSKNS
jgi:hypothetical protein